MFLIGVPKMVFSQLAAGNYTVGTLGGEDYISLTNSGGIFEAINTVGLSGNITILITSDLLTESGTLALNNWSGGWSVSIVPQTASVKTIAYSGGCGNDMILINGADLLTIDGRFSGGGTSRYLRFASNCPAQSAIQLDNDCENVTIRNCIIASDNSMSSFGDGGAIHISDNQTTGSDNLVIKDNLIEDYSGAIDLFDAIQINAPDVTGGILTGLIIEGNEFSNVNGKGIFLIGQDGEINGAEILRNSLYAKATITGPGPGWTFTLIQIASGSGHNIRANYLGGQGAYCSGSKMDINLGAGTQSVIMIRTTSSLPNAASNKIDSNVIKNLNIGGSASNRMFASLFRIEGGNCDIGVINGNFIGDRTVDASLAASASIVVSENYNSTSNYFRVFNITTSGNVNVENNEVGGILIEDNNSDGIKSFLCYSQDTPVNFRKNKLGGISNNIVKKADGEFVGIYSNDNISSSEVIENSISGITLNSNFDEDFYGISSRDGLGAPTISKNTIQNISVGDGLKEPRIYLIYVRTGGAQVDSNLISSITTNSAYSGTQFYGIYVREDASNFNVSANTITNVTLSYALASPSTDAIGIYTDGASRFNISGNFIEKFYINSGHSSSDFKGIHLHTSVENNLTNNVVLVDNNSNNTPTSLYGIYDQSSSGINKIWHNTIDIRGTGGSRRSACYYRTNGATRNIQNNVFNNRRLGTSSHYAMYNSSTSGSMISDYNLLHVEDDFSRLVHYSSGHTFASWQATGFGANSISIPVTQNLVDSSTGEHVTNAGVDVGNNALGIVTTYDNVARPLGAGFDLGAFEISDNLRVPLPIELINFDANFIDDKVEIIWATALEKNNDYFTIERSNDALLFNEILKVNGAGNSDNLMEYFEVDLKPLKGRSYYRLKQTDFDGKFSYSNVAPVSNSSDIEMDLLIYPNPMTINQELNFRVEGLKNNTVIVVIREIRGEEVFSKRVLVDSDQNVSINISEGKLSQGTYFVTIFSDDKEYSKKLIIK